MEEAQSILFFVSSFGETIIDKKYSGLEMEMIGIESKQHYLRMFRFGAILDST